MKIIDNKTTTYLNLKNNSQLSPNFGGKNSLKSVINPKSQKIMSAVSTALGVASISTNKNNKLDDDDLEYNKFRSSLLEKKTIYNCNGNQKPSYNESDIELIMNMYTLNPEFVKKLINMQTTTQYTKSQRFSAIAIRNLVTLGKENPDLMNRLLNEYTLDEDNNIKYTYNKDVIYKIMEYSKKNPEFIEHILSIKTEKNGIQIPKYTQDFEFDLLSIAYNKTPQIVDELIYIDELMPKDINNIATTFNPQLYAALKNNLPEKVALSDFLNFHFSILNKLNKDIQDMTIKEKELIILCLENEIPTVDLEAYKKYYPDFVNKINQIKISLGRNKSNIITPAEKQRLFVKNILANNNPKTEEVLKNFDFAKYQNEGLPLKYSRENFIKKINTLIKDLTLQEQNELLNAFGFIKGDADFDGLITNNPTKINNISSNSEDIAKEIQKEIELFTLENEVITGDKEADTVLTGLIQGLPEFAYFVGKKQHRTHKYSVDIHTLKVLQNIMNNPHYAELSDNSKTILKMSVLMHDFGKKGGVRDPGHAKLSSAYAESILDKYPFSEELKIRIIDIIDNHHWFEAYNLNRTAPHDVAALCRHPEDILIYSMFAKADLRNVNDNFHLRCTDSINENRFEKFMTNKMSPIYDKYTEMRQNNNFVFDTKFMNNGEKFPRETVIIDEKQIKLKVLNFNKLTNGENLQKYGFAPNVTKENAHFLVHQTNVSNFDDTWKLIHNYTNKVAWSTSLVKNDDNDTVAAYGFIFNEDQANISIAHPSNLSTGKLKNHQDFFNILFLEENDDMKVKENKYKEKRVFLRDNFLKSLEAKGIKLNKEEFALLSEQIISKKYLTQIKDDIQIGNKTIKATDIVNALEETRNSLFGNVGHNEVVCILPTVKGLFAKANSLNECPKEFLEFAAKHDLPIVIM